MENFVEFLGEIGMVAGILGLLLYPLSGLFRNKGHYYNGTGEPTGSYKLNGKFDKYGKFEGDVTPEYNNGGYIEGSKNLAGQILSGIGAGLIAWTIAWWGLQFINCFSCFFSSDLNAMSKNDDAVAILAFIIGGIVGLIEFMNAD